LVPITLKDGIHIPAGTRIARAKTDVVYVDAAVQSFDEHHITIGIVQMLMLKSLSDYKFKYPEGKERPQNFSGDEY
jgi:hypothetical protein